MKVLDLAPLLIASIETGFDDVFIDPLHRQSSHGLARESEVGGMTGVARVLFPDPAAVIENQIRVDLLGLIHPGTTVVREPFDPGGLLSLTNDLHLSLRAAAGSEQCSHAWHQ